MTSPAKRHAAFQRLAAHVQVLAVARDVCGVHSPDCIVDQVNFKSPRVGTGFPWHQARPRLSCYTSISRVKHHTMDVVRRAVEVCTWPSTSPLITTKRKLLFDHSTNL